MDNRTKRVVLFLNFLMMVTAQETTVPCLYNSSCLLSCNYKTGTATIIYWNYMTGGDVIVHSFYNDRDQFDHQDPRYKGRTSLVEDQDTERTTELLLKNVKVQNEGKYQCFADSEELGHKTSTVFLQVDAPVQRVDMVRAGNSATCSSEGVYPEPKLTWSSSPQSNSTVQQTEEKLYNISSSLELSDMDGDLLLSCTVSTRLNKWTTTTTWRNPNIIYTVVVPVVVGVIMVVVIVIIMVLVYCWKHSKSDPMRGQPLERGRVQNNEHEMEMMRNDSEMDQQKNQTLRDPKKPHSDFCLVSSNQG